jgi:antibiotic biosynthesis monooxygenase (ABM) superfamily enzyme
VPALGPVVRAVLIFTVVMMMMMMMMVMIMMMMMMMIMMMMMAGWLRGSRHRVTCRCQHWGRW